MAKQKFKITNWSAYNKALRQRGSLTIWLDESAIAAWTDCAKPEGRGRPLHYTYMAITTVLMMKRVFNLPLRALQGFVDSIFTLMALPLRCPDYSLVSKHAKS
ncbi:transposase, partial [Escherichia coli]